MREVDTSETSVVWPAWCYSGETTVNEDLPQRLVAAAAAVAAATTTVAPSTQKERRRRRRRRQQQPQPPSAHHHQRAPSNQSRRSSSSASVSSPSPPPLPPAPSSVLVGRGKRKSITRTTPLGSPVGSGSAITAALEAAGSAVELGGSTTTSHYDGRSSPAATALQLLTGCRGGRSSDSEEKEAPGRTGAEVNECYRFGAIDSRVLRQHRAALHSLDKMLSERIYDRKKYLNSPTGGGGGGASGTAGSPTGGTGFYEKYRHLNGSSSAGDTGGSVIELSLIKNGTVATGGGGGGGSSINGVGGSSAHLSAIAASIISGSNGSSSGNGGIPGDATPAASNGGAGGGGSGSGSLGNTNQITSNKPSGNNNNNNNNSSANNNNNIGGGQCLNQHSNSSSIKSERFSPPNTDAQSMASRSRSATPSSFSGTPPQTMHPGGGGGGGAGDGFPVASGLLPSPNSLSTVGRPEFQARNYSDFMRSLAAKYNNNNNNSNDVSQNMKNSFLEPKMRFTQPKSFIEGGKKSSPLTSTQVPNPSIMTSLFSGLPFQSAVFPPLIDMSSTQALVTLARAAKESDIHHILKTDTGGGLNRKPSSLSRSSSPSGGAHHHQHHFPSPFAATGYLPGLLPSHHHGLASGFPSQPSVVSSVSGSLKSPSRAPEPTLATTFPLDLSASTPTPSKRIKLSPTASSLRHREASPAPSSTNSQPSDSLLDLKPASRKCHARIEEIGAWTVDHVCEFVASIDICAEYVQNFRDQSIDGAGLPLLTEEHLTNSLGMKLGPALKLRSMLAKKLGGPCPCTLCAAVPTPPTRTNSSGSGSSKGDTTPTNRPPSNGSIG